MTIVLIVPKDVNYKTGTIMTFVIPVPKIIGKIYLKGMTNVIPLRLASHSSNQKSNY